MDPSQVAMITVRYHSKYVVGLKMLSKAGTVLLDAGFNSGYSTQTIALADGERLIGIRSQQRRDDS